MDSWTWLGFYTAVTSAAEVKRKAKAGAVPVDLRSAEDFSAGHLPGAIHVPADEILANSGAFEARIRKSRPEVKAVTLYLE